MHSRERLRRCYYHEELDRPAVYSRTGMPANDPSYNKLKAYLHDYADLKLPWNARNWGWGQAPITERTEDYSADYARHIRTLHTPAGSLEETRFIGLKGQPGLHESFFIKTPEDVEVYLSLPEPSEKSDVSSFFRAQAEMADRGIIDVNLGPNAVGFVAGYLTGSETFALLSITDRNALHALCEREARVIMKRLKYLIAQVVGPFFSLLGHEYVIPPLHSPKDFRDFCVQYDAPLLDLIHEAGGAVHIHCHGPVSKVFDDFLEMRVDVLHPIEPPPIGNVTATEAKARAGSRMCIEGNIQIAHMYEHSPKQVQEEVEALIADAFTDRQGLIVSPTASPYIFGAGDACFGQYKAMIDTVINWKP